VRGRGTRDAGLGALVVLAFTASPVPAQQKVPLVLHHLVVDVDTVTWNDIAHSPFIREQFAAYQAGDLNPPDAGRGLRLIGRYSYLQIMSAAVPGNVAIVLASERSGGLAQVRSQGAFMAGRVWSERDHRSSEGIHVVELADRIRPAGADSTSAPVGFELLQYTTEAARRRFLVDSLPDANRSTARFLAEYFDAKKLFSHLTAATLAMPVEDIQKIARVLQRDGIVVVQEGEGAILRLDGFTLHLIPPYRGAGVKQLQFALTHAAPANPTYRFGPKSQLRFGPGLIAVWDFESK
jgi:hypothetical protein